MTQINGTTSQIDISKAVSETDLDIDFKVIKKMKDSRKP